MKGFVVVGTMWYNKNKRIYTTKTKVNVLWKKIESMVEHLNVFEGFINETVSLDMPLADEVLALLLLLGSLLGSWETLMVILVNSTPQGKLT